MKLFGTGWRRPFAVPFAFLVAHAVLAIWCSTRHSPNFDESAHLVSGLAIWHLSHGDVYPHNPPLVRAISALPVYLSAHRTDWSMLDAHPLTRRELRLGSDFVAVNSDRWLVLFSMARWTCSVVSLLGGLLCWRWATTLYGNRAGVTAAAIWCFSPTVLGSAHTVTPDVGAASFGLAAAYTFSKWLRRPDWRSAIIAGVVLGVAELTKFTWLVLFGLWPLLWCIRVWMYFDWMSLARVRREGGQLFVALTLAVWTINAGYGFSQTMKPLGDFAFFSRALSGITFQRHTIGDGANRFTGKWLGKLPIPLPADFVQGIDLQKREFELGYRSYVRGVWEREGRWYYYVYTLGLKTPLGTLILFGVAIWSRFRSSIKRHAVLDELVLLAPAAIVFLLVSSQTGINSYHRYVLPVLPFFFVWMSQTAESVSRRVCFLARGLVWWATLSSLAVFPHFGSYFNALAGGPDSGPEYLVDSNVGWGQDLIFLREWLEAHPQASPVGLAYYGSIDPRDLGIEFFLPAKGGSTSQATGDCSGRDHTIGPLPGWYAVDASFVHGLRKQLPDGEGGWNAFWEGHCDFTYFSKFQPIAKAGYSIFIYHITPKEANRVRQDLGLSKVADVHGAYSNPSKPSTAEQKVRNGS